VVIEWYPLVEDRSRACQALDRAESSKWCLLE
jgi:hypothetical protein